MKQILNTQGKVLDNIIKGANKAIGVFTDVVQSLTKANEQLDKVIDEAQVNIDYNKDIKSKAIAQAKENNAIIGKINQIVGN